MKSNRKIAASCVHPRLNTEYYYSDENYKKLIHTLLEYGVSGFCIFGGEVSQVKKMISELRSISEQPLLFSADLEHGLPMRFQGGTAFPHAMAIGRTEDPNKSGVIGKLIAMEAKNLGIDWNFAPVCDINSNPKNPIINIRSYGEDAKTVSEHSVYYMKGTQAEKVIATAKHFPGHGDTDIDSHLDLPLLNHSRELIEERDLKPFKNLIKNGVKSVMIGHLNVPALDDSGKPASLSKKIITKLLRDELGFEGLIVSDALEMNSITNNYESGEAAYLFLKAGGDVALIPENPFDAIEYIEEKLKEDEDLKEHLIKSYSRIKKEMDFVGAFNPPKADDDFKQEYMQHERMALDFARDALELKIKSNVIPIEPGIQYASFAFLQKEEDLKQAGMLFHFMGQAIENNCDFSFINEDISDEDLEQMKIGTADADLFLFAFFNKSRSYNSTLGLTEKMSMIMKKLSMGKPTICVFLGNPYMEKEISYDTAILTYSDSLASLAATTMILSGRTNDPQEMQGINKGE